MNRYWKIVRRLLLLLLPLPCLAIVFGELNNIYYLSASFFISSYIILLNMPQVVKWMYKKEITFEDLEDRKCLASTIVKKRFQFYLICFSQFLLAIMMTILFDYYFNRFQDTTLSNLEVLGVVVGIIELFAKVNKLIGQFLLNSLNFYKIYSPHIVPRNPSNERSLSLSISRNLSGITLNPAKGNEIEMTEIGSDMGSKDNNNNYKDNRNFNGHFYGFNNENNNGNNKDGNNGSKNNGNLKIINILAESNKKDNN